MSNPLDHLTSALADRYTIERELGRGGMAVVYLAEDLKHDRKVAIKVLRPELSATMGAERFLREIKIAANLNHPHILGVFDSGRTGGQADGRTEEFLYYVMPYVEGETLRDRLLRERQLPIEDALALTREVASALSYAHDQGVIHRDIKPENIMLSPGGAVVADFGIARAVSAAGGEQLTETGMAVGTPAYMSPEQATADTVDARTDIYSLGTVLYEMLGGDPPFLGTTPQAIIARKAAEPAPPLRAVRDTVPEALEQVVLKALARTPADRFTTVADLIAALEPASLELAATRPSNFQPSRRRQWIVAGAVVAVVALVLTLLGRRDESSGAPPHYTSLATLPVVNMTGDTSWDSEAMGMTLLLRQSLSLLKREANLSQRSLQNVISATDLAQSQLEIASRLGVDVLVEPTLIASGGTVIMNVDLVDGRDGELLWTQSYDRPFPEMHQTYEEITLAVSDELGLTINPDAIGITSVVHLDSVAYRHFLRGQGLLRKVAWEEGDRTELVRSGELAAAAFHAAIDRDSSFASAYAGLGQTYFMFGNQGIMAAEDAFRLAFDWSERAEALNPEAPFVPFVVATSAWFQMRWEDARRGYEVALASDPYDQDALLFSTQLLADLGLREQAVEQAERLVESNPGSAMYLDHNAFVCALVNDIHCAVQKSEMAIARDPTNHQYCPSRAVYLSLAGMHELALAHLTECEGGHDRLRALLQARAGDHEAAREWLASNSDWAPPLLAAIGEIDSAFELMEDAIEGLGYLRRLPSEPFFAPLRGHPRFDALLQVMNLECEYFEDGTHRCWEYGTRGESN